jgi:hypothetical protein
VKNKDTHNSENSYTAPAGFPTDIARLHRHADGMTQARAQLVIAGSDSRYHCVQRCVRRAFLCGEDRYTGQSFEHRKAWIEQRLSLLADCFAVSIHAFAVMSNHLHVVVQMAPATAAAWRDEDVAARWVRLFPPREQSHEAVQAKSRRMLADGARLATLRTRLCDLSWLMRCLAEPIARRANREDGCKGRFWEGRFKAQRLCDERALLAAMAYVDLNPIRAGKAQGLDDSAHTSIAARLAHTRATPQTLRAGIGPILGVLQPPLAISTADYLQLLDWTGRQLVPCKHGRITAPAPACLQRIETEPARWAARVRAIGSGYWRAVGTAEALMALAKSIGQCWLKGLTLAHRLG